ncbi:hypothetical protein FS749_005056 [Ceratobasidium sp. UAMH 11750]|nr:hypothetical protein FS749_005056 [Ceratobasidium sp. UAMH 11750]
MFTPRSEPRLNTYRTFTEDESPMATPTRRAVKTAAPTAADKSFQFTNPMFHLDANGYPTRALYYLHKRLLDVLVCPKSRNFVLTTPPLSPHFTPPEDEDHLDLGEDPTKLVQISEQNQVLHHLCATIISKDYVRPPTPPIGASPCHTPPRFDHLVVPSVEHDETACRIARLLVQSNACDVEDMDMLDMLEIELELDLEAGDATPKTVTDGNGAKIHAWSCPATIERPRREEQEDKENYPMLAGKKRTLFEEMDGVATPCAKSGNVVNMTTSEDRRKQKQARRRARNSLNGVIEMRV